MTRGFQLSIRLATKIYLTVNDTWIPAVNQVREHSLMMAKVVAKGRLWRAFSRSYEQTDLPHNFPYNFARINYDVSPLMSY